MASTVGATEVAAPEAVHEPPAASPPPAADPPQPAPGNVGPDIPPAGDGGLQKPATTAPAPAASSIPPAAAVAESLPTNPGAKLTLKAPAKDWMLKAEEASDAMQGVDMREAKNLSEDDIRTLQELQQTVGDLLRMYTALKN